MKQKVSWPVAAMLIWRIVLLVARAVSSGGQRRLGGADFAAVPADEPAEQAALMNAERARRSRSAPPSPAGQ